MIYESRLLIVESKGLADAIDRLNIPYLTTFPTEGYLWGPVFDAKSGRLKAKAVPERRRHRKELKEQIAWAASWMIACDSDPSGDFIAWSIGNQLGLSTVNRCTIFTPSRDSVIHSLQTIRTVEVDSLRIALENEFGISQIWKDVVGYSPLDAMALASMCLLNEETRENSYGRSGVAGGLGKLVDFLGAVKEGDRYGFVAPASTATLFEAWMEMVATSKARDLERAREELGARDSQRMGVKYGARDSQRADSKSKVLSFSAHAELFFESLNRLFAYRDFRIDHPLISYPRTMERGYFAESWDRIQQQFVHIDDLERMKPPSAREIPRSESAHESLYPLDLRIRPSDVRGYLQKNEWWLYHAIYSHHIEAISMYPKARASSQPSDKWIRISDFALHLSRLNVLRASGLGSAFSRWFEKGWIDIDGPYVRIGVVPELASRMANQWLQAWTRICLPTMIDRKPLEFHGFKGSLEGALES